VVGITTKLLPDADGLFNPPVTATTKLYEAVVSLVVTMQSEIDDTTAGSIN